MTLRDRWRRWRNRPQRKKAAEPRPEPTKDDLREFVYLDEVSLRSLLSSLQGDLRDGRSEETADEFQVEAATNLEATNALVGTAGVSSRFQTTNSSTIQTSRKATVQSWFRDFRKIAGLRLIEVAEVKDPAIDLDALLTTTDKSLLVSPEDLRRGELVEFRVKLSADPVYRLSTMVTEFTGMADDFPDMFAAGDTLGSLQQVQPVNKILERLLAGLIPIRATAVDYSVITVDEVKYVVHNDLIKNLSIGREPLQIVGLTEHLAYWKDLRRVLFSDAEFTLLGRVSRPGVHSSWTPVKLADMFQDLVPDLVGQINAAGRLPPAGAEAAVAVDPNSAKLAKALELYVEASLIATDKMLDEADQTTLAGEIAILSVRSGSASEQRAAFSVAGARLQELTGAKVGPKRDLKLREQARVSSGLPLFPVLSSNALAQVSPPASETKAETEHLIDVEVIAIYW